jgi:two-component system response regulator RegA
MSSSDDVYSVLLVDDDVVFVETLGRALARRGYKVTVCVSTEEAKRSIGENPPRNAVVDLRLPDGSGLSLVGLIKEGNPHATIVVLTGFGSIASAVEAVKLGATNYLCKPVDADAVVVALSGAATEAPPLDSSKQPLTVMRLEWEHINRVLSENDGNISATARALNMHRRTLQRKLLKHPVRH